MFTPANYKYGQLQNRFLDTVGDTTGAIDMSVDGSVTPVEFKLKCPAGFNVHLEAVSVLIQDEGQLPLGEYGNELALTNGIQILVRNADGSVRNDVTDQLAIKSNADWLAYAFKITSLDFFDGQSVLAVTSNLNEGGRPLRLSEGQEYVFVVRDNLVGLTRQLVHTSSVFVPV